MARRMWASIAGMALVLPGMLGIVGAPTGALATAAAALEGSVGRLPSTQPAGGTPHVLDGEAVTIVQVGSTILVGGSFTSARNSGDPTVLGRSNLLAFDARTGAISTTFVPEPNGPVEVLLPAGDGRTVYVGGRFTSIGGQPRKNLVQLDVSDGSVVTGFKPGSITGKVNDLRLSGGRLWVAGGFSSVAGQPQPALATVDPTSGAFDPYMGLAIAGIHNGGSTSVRKIDVSPDGRDLVAIGNFRTLQGVRHQQALRLDLSSPTTAAPERWQTSFFETPCGSDWWSYVTDVDIAPDGSYFVVVTTGGYGGVDAACDSTSRWEMASQGQGVRPSWIDNTGGDTMWSVEITDSVVYLGGHFKFQNNPLGVNVAAAGAVARPGIAALDPMNGLPLTWNPTRARGVGLFDFLVTPDGVWVVSDTDRIGDQQYRGRIALLPWQGGTTFPIATTPGLPNDLFAVTADRLTRHAATTTSVGGATAAPAGVDWRTVRGAFMLNGEVYLATGDGAFAKRSFDGTSWGAPVRVNTSDLLSPLTSWADDIRSMTGLFYDSGRLYFTRAKSKQLFFRYFAPESGVVGTNRYVASTGVAGIAFDQVQGLFVGGDRLHWTAKDGKMRAIRWSRGAFAGAPVAGTATVVPSSHNWGNVRAPFLYQPVAPTPPPAEQPPVAAFTASCSQRSCTLDASGSTDPDGDHGALVYAWQLGDGTTASGPRAEHAYATAGRYEVTLTVTDGAGLSGSATRVLTPSDTGIVPVASAGTNGNRVNHTVAVPGAVQPGDQLLLFISLNNSTTALADPEGWSLVPGGAVESRGLRHRVWTKVATATDPGSTVRVTTSETSKSDLSVSAYRATPGADLSVSASVSATRTAGLTSYATPAVDVPSTGPSWVVSYWATKSTSNPVWTAPTGETVRWSSVGSGTGGVSGLLTDSGRAVTGPRAGEVVSTVDPAGGQTATSTVVVTAQPRQ